MHKTIALSSVALLLILAAGPVQAGSDGHGDAEMAAKIAAAETAADHEALAAEYAEQAAAARKEAERHDRMGKSYSTPFKRTAMKRHCEILAKNYRENAEQLDALAEGERKMAAQAGK